MKKILAGLLVCSMLVLFGCGGSGSSGPATATGKFIDAPVARMTYVSGGQKGVTAADGSFTYEVGQPVTFSIGGIVLGTAPGQAIVTPVTLAAAGSTEATPEVLARVQFLMTISSTDPAMGVITITPAVMTAAAGKSIVWTATTVQSDLNTLTTLLVPSATLVTPAAAQTHMTNSRTLIQMGGYSVKFTTVMLSGKTFTDSSNGGPITFNADGTFISSNSTSTTKTWSINSSGQILVRNTGDTGTGTSIVTLLPGDTTTGLKYFVVNSDGTNSTGTLTLGTSTPTTPTTINKYVLDTSWPAYNGATPTTSFAQVIQFYDSNVNGNILGVGGNGINAGMKFSSAGQVFFYSVKYLANGTIDSSYTPYVIANGTWNTVTVAGNQVVLIDTSPIRTLAPNNIIFALSGGVLYTGSVLPGPTTTLPQSAPFTASMVAGKTMTLALPNGIVRATLAANGSMAGTNTDGTALSSGLTWVINSDGTISLGGKITLTITSGSGSTFQVAYTQSEYIVLGTAVQQLGPIAMTIL